MQKQLILTIAAVLILVPASAQLGADLTVEVDETVDVEAEVDSSSQTNATIDATIEPPEITIEADATAWDQEEGNESRYGHIEYSQDQAQGRYMGLHVGARGIEDYKVGQDTFFATIDLGPLSAHAAGARLHAAFPGGHVQATDAASAGLRVDADRESSATIRLAPAVTVEPASDRMVWLEAGGRSGALAVLGNGSIDADGSSLAIQLGPGAILRFEAQDQDERAWRDEQQSFASGRLGAELGIMKGDDAHTTVTDEYTVNVSNVRATAGSVAFTVDSEMPHPRVVTVALDAALLSSSAQMRFDGQPAQRAHAASDVYAANSSVAIYSLVETDGALHAVIHVPGFSAHDIEFLPAPDGGRSEAGEDAPGIGWLPLGGVVGLLAMVRRLR